MTSQASVIKLLEVATDTAVAAELCHGIEDSHLDDWETKWVPAHAAILLDLVQRGVSKYEWPQSLHWNWQRKMAQSGGFLAHCGFSVVCAGETQGLMRVDLNKTGRIDGQKGKPLVYIEFLEVAPWNQSIPGGAPGRYKGVGTSLLRAAVLLSKAEGFSGRIALHSLPQSEPFYKRLNIFADFGLEEAYENLRYFEATADQVRRLI